jgi:uncharacterized protein (TIGR02246 family)
MSSMSAVAREIATLNEAAMEAFRRKDAVALAAGFTADGQFLGAHQPIATGRNAIAAAWETMLSLPNVRAQWGSVQVVTAGSGELAYEIGTYRLVFDGPDGRITDTGKYIVVWRKEGARWLIAADMINSDLPLAG